MFVVEVALGNSPGCVGAIDSYVHGTILEEFVVLWPSIIKTQLRYSTWIS